MKKKIISYMSLVSFAIPVLLAGCTQDDILYEADYNVTLDKNNTYYAGDPVTFNFDGEVDNLLFYSGETGHEYQYRDRYTVGIDDVEAVTLDLQIYPRYGKGSLQIWYSNEFAGLSGNDGAADRTVMSQQEEGGMQGWKNIYSSATNEPSITSGNPISVTMDVTDAKTNFSLAFLWDHSDPAQTQRTYWINGSLSVKAKDIDYLITTDLSDLFMTTVMMNEEVDPYYKNAGNGSIVLNGDQDINFQGCNADAVDYLLKGWVVTTPQTLNAVQNDQGTVVKNMQNYMTSYSYTYDEPGTYTAVFVGRNANYVGSSELVKEVTVTILDRPLDEGEGGTSDEGGTESAPEA